MINSKQKIPGSSNILASKSGLNLKDIISSPELVLLDLDQKRVIYDNVPEVYEIEYPFLLIQPSDCYILIEAMSDGKQPLAESVLISKLSQVLNYFGESVNHQTRNDRLAQREILKNFVVLSFLHGYKIGFDAIQMSIFLSIFLECLKETISRIKTEHGFHESNLVQLFKNRFLHYIELQDEHIKLPESKFTTVQYRNIISFITSEIGCNFKLLKYVCLQPQELLVTKITKELQFISPLPLSLSTSIKDEDWAQYCLDEEKKRKLELEYQENLQLCKLEMEAEERNQQIAEAKTLAIAVKLAEFEKTISLPLDPFPVPPPSLPTLDTIFRRKTIIHEPDEPPSIVNGNDESKSSSAGGGKKSSKASTPESREKLPISTANPQKRRDLPPPPDITKLAPLEKPKPKTPIVKATKVKTGPKVVYEQIPVETALTRQETEEIIKSSVQDAVEEYKKWALEKANYEAKQRADRQVKLEKILKEKEEDRLYNLARLQENQIRRKAWEAKLNRSTKEQTDTPSKKKTK